MNKKTVADDALISTDIDNIIKYLSSKKRVEMGALARQFGMKRDSIKRWIGILEDEGYVQIEYHLLNEFVVWSGEELPASQAEEPRVPDKKEPGFFDQPQYNPRGDASPGPEAQKQELEQKPESKNERKMELPEPVHEDIKAEERVERIMERVNRKQPRDDIADSIISSFAEEEKGAGQRSEPAPASEPQAGRNSMPARERMPFVKFSNSFKGEKKQPQKEKRDAHMEKAREEMVSLRRSLSEYMGEIRVQREDLEKLKAEREAFLAKAYLPLEGKFKAAYDGMADRILEKEGKIIELKERLMELPQKMGEADKLAEALKRIREGVRGSLSANREEMEKLKKSLVSEDSKIAAEIESLEKDIKSKKADMIDLSGSVSSLESKEQELRKSMEGLNKQLTEVNEGIATSYAAIAGLSQKRAEMAARLDGIKSDLEAKSSEVADSYAKLKDVKQAEALINEYLSDYQSKIADIEQYAADSQRELSQLKEFAEIRYMKGYLKELESVSGSYNEEYEQVKAQEQSLNDRVAEAKKNIENLVRESRELVKTMEKKTSGKEFEALLSEVKAKQEAVVATVNEKAAEREKLAPQPGQSGGSRAGKQPAVQSGKGQKKAQERAEKKGKKKRR